MLKNATYKLVSGKEIVVEYDSEAPCKYCGMSVGEASAGGTNLCPYCDMGVHRDGTPWTYEDMVGYYSSGDATNNNVRKARLAVRRVLGRGQNSYRQYIEEK